jgi:spermidine/putrescine transport system substrate-binding protein
MYAKLKSGSSSYDIIIPSDYMIARMINEEMLETLDFSNIPNYALISDNFKNNDFDPSNEYSVPYMWGIMGIIYNTKLVDESDDISTWDILWNEKYAKDILMFSNSRDAFGISLMRLGYSINTTDEKQLREAADELSKQKLLVQAYVMDEIFDKMGGGEAAIAPYYAGDAITMMADNPDLAFVVPKEGTNVFVDAVCIPRGAKNKAAAELYINFLCETTVAQKNCEYIGYSTPHTGAFELLDDQTKNSISYPSAEILNKTEAYLALPPETTKLIDSLWTDLMSETDANPWLTPALMTVSITLIVFINIRRRRKKKMKEL